MNNYKLKRKMVAFIWLFDSVVFHQVFRVHELPEVPLAWFTIATDSAQSLEECSFV